jgi:hypothetical protein
MMIQLVKKIVTKFAVAKKAARLEGMTYRSPRIYLPTKLTDDSTFPFKEGDVIAVRIDGRKLVVQRAPKAIMAEATTSEAKGEPIIRRLNAVPSKD